MEEELGEIKLNKQVSHESEREVEKDFEEEIFDHEDEEEEILAAETENINSLNDL